MRGNPSVKFQPPQLDFMKSLAFTPWRSSVNYDLGVRHTHTHSVACFERFGVESSPPPPRFLPSREGGERGSGGHATDMGQGSGT